MKYFANWTKNSKLTEKLTLAIFSKHESLDQFGFFEKWSPIIFFHKNQTQIYRSGFVAVLKNPAGN